MINPFFIQMYSTMAHGRAPYGYAHEFRALQTYHNAFLRNADSVHAQYAEFLKTYMPAKLAGIAAMCKGLCFVD